jgi:hypothetical protein
MNKPAAPAPLERAPAIPVAKMRFTGPIDLQGGNDASFGIQAKARSDFFDEKEKRKGGSGFVIEYQPWMRHFRVDYYDVTSTEPKVRYVHESQVKCWDPLG